MKWSTCLCPHWHNRPEIEGSKQEMLQALLHCSTLEESNGRLVFFCMIPKPRSLNWKSGPIMKQKALVTPRPLFPLTSDISIHKTIIKNNPKIKIIHKKRMHWYWSILARHICNTLILSRSTYAPYTFPRFVKIIELRMIYGTVYIQLIWSIDSWTVI